jgi:peptidoglycan/xylan/chitin deacetylase (PgdA/CDA1 family)
MDGDAQRPLIYLTYDDGPNPTATPALLDPLGAGGASATFFVIDRYVTDETTPIVKRMFAEGHAVALHARSRKLMVETPEQLTARLTRNADRIEQLAGSRPCPLFSPHAGWRSGSMYEGLARIDYRLVGWNWGLWDSTGIADARRNRWRAGSPAGRLQATSS